jgi:hypothetical protein
MLYFLQVLSFRSGSPQTSAYAYMNPRLLGDTSAKEKKNY